MKYLCIFDLDETLLSSDKNISAENIEAIHKLSEMGVGVTIATGRSQFLFRKYAEQLSITLPVITCNGGILFSPQNAEIIWKNTIEDIDVRNLLSYLFEQRADFLAYSDHMVYFPQGSKKISVFHNYNKTVPADRQAPLQEITYDYLSTASNQSLPNIAKILLYNASDEQTAYLKSVSGLEVVSSMEKCLDIMKKGTTKGNALVSLAELLQIPLQNIAAFGDNENDISMFTSGVLGIAMGNSSAFVRKKARYVTGTNNESGVAQGIYKYVLPYFGLST